MIRIDDKRYRQECSHSRERVLVSDTEDIEEHAYALRFINMLA